MKARALLGAFGRGFLFVQVFIVFLLLTGSASAQFTGNIQGTVEDPSGAAIAQAKVALLNLATQASAATISDMKLVDTVTREAARSANASARRSRQRRCSP